MYSDYETKSVRLSVVAGQFYPSTAGTLHQAIEQAFLSPLGPGVLPQLRPVRATEKMFGVVVPHAGFMYSAPAAAWAFAELARGGKPEAVILLGVNHRGVGSSIAVSPASGWQTPFGIMPIARQLIEELLRDNAMVCSDAIAHAGEHSLEVEVPFLQYLFGKVLLLPIALGHLSFREIVALGTSLADLAKTHDLVFVASSDFSHYLPAEQARCLDMLAIQSIIEIDPQGLWDIVRTKQISMCGVIPVAVMLVAAQIMGIKKGKLLHYHTSGDVTGDQSEVVGYGAVVI